jgi:cytochrome c biogenesis protein CcmG, thiol:disulfide interchange protein DsbE
MVPPEELEEYPRPKFRRFFLLPVAILIAGAVVYGVLRPAPDRQDGSSSVAPEFELPLLGGGTLSSDELKGDPVVINVWASWCGPCREEAPEFERVWRAYKDRGLRVIGVNTQDTDEAAQAFVDDYGLTYPIVRDAEQSLYRDLADIDGLPQTFFIDTEWRFVAEESGEELDSRGGTVVLGAISGADLERRIEELLGDAPPDPSP